jgi:DUF1009 family protein
MMSKIGLILGGGGLASSLVKRCTQSGRPFHLIRLRGFADVGTEGFGGDTIGIAELGKVIKTLKVNGCDAICFAGVVTRPDMSALKPDMKGLSILPGAIAAARHGDDALMRYMLGVFEAEGFKIEGADAVDAGLTLGLGALGAVAPGPEHASDIAKAADTARAMGVLDIGQGAVVVDGLVLAVEAQEGTDAMLTRCADLPPEIRGAMDMRRGVLAKCPKPIQELRIDLPTIGVSTLERAANAGLAGIVGEAGRLLVIDREAVIAAADRLGLFVVGIEPHG